MLSACGVNAYWTPITASAPLSETAPESTPAAAESLFSGTLKDRPEDFVVMEVDLSGQCTALDTATKAATYLFAPPPPLASRATGSLQSVPAERPLLEEEADAEAPEEGARTTAETHAPVGTTTLADVVRRLAAASPALVTTLGSLEAVTQRAQALDRQALARVVAALFPTRCPVRGLGAPSAATTTPAEPETDWWLLQVPLSDGADKSARRWAHMAVRHRYPHLRSYTGPTSSPSASEATSASPSGVSLMVAVDTHYVFLTAVLGASVARLMAQWAAMDGEHSATAEERETLAKMNADAGVEPAWDARTPLSTTTTFRDLPRENDDGPASLSDKDARRCFHELRKRFYPYVACTVQDGHVRLRYAPRAPALGRTDGSRRRPRETDSTEGNTATTSHASQRGPATDASPSPTLPSSVFTYLLVRKQNVETAEMKKLVAEYLGVPESSVCVAGMKDKKAITYQRCSVPGDHIARLTGMPPSATLSTPSLMSDAAEARAVNPAVILRWPSDPLSSTVTLSHCAAHVFTAPIHIGELSGNRFCVRLRDVVCPRSAPFLPSRDITTTLIPEEALTAAARDGLTRRFQAVVAHGFINYFGQQRFSESVESLTDHTGIHLFGHRYVHAVRSLYRSCPEVYDGFPATMDARTVPGNVRDAQAMTHALRQTYRMYFSELPLSREDVARESDLWKEICTKAICESMPFALRAMWVHAAQSLYFNVCASFVAHRMQATAALSEGPDDVAQTGAMLPVPTLPLAGYQVAQNDTLSPHWEAAHAHAVQCLDLTSEELLGQRRVAGVPVPGSQRALLVFPSQATLDFEDAATTGGERSLSGTATPAHDVEDAQSSTADVHCGHAVLSFSLPSSCYATIFLREVFGNSVWW